MFVLVFLLTAFASLCADENQSVITMLNEPSALVEGKVNAVTGEPCFAQTDLIIQGAEPIRIYRTYVSVIDANNIKRWEWMVNHTFARYSDDPDANEDEWDESVCEVAEKNGCPIIFKKECKKKIDGVTQIRFIPKNLTKGFSNTCHGTPSSRTNVKNDYLLIKGSSLDPEDFKFLKYHSADGTVREYKKIHDSSHPIDRQFRLLSEHLPNGRWILYDYYEEAGEGGSARFLLKSIQTTNPSKTKTFARADFIYQDKKSKSLEYHILGSDGQIVKYKSNEWKLSAADPQNGLKQFLQYEENYSDSDLLKTIRFPKFRTLAFGYYLKTEETVANKTVSTTGDNKAKRRRIKTISAPVGLNETMHITHSLLYSLDKQTSADQLDDQVTTVYDAEDNYTEYGISHFDYRLSEIRRFDKNKHLLNMDKFCWDTCKNIGCLMYKSLLDSQKKPVICKGYVYDERGNVLEERTYGNLSGHGPQISYSDLQKYTGPQGVETYTKRFSYAGEPNLLVQEEEPSGKRTVYAYLPGTDLPVSCLVYDRADLKFRTFFEYNSDHVLVLEIHDDGISSDKNNLAGMRVRTTREIIPCSGGAYYGLPEVIAEKYWEKGQERLVKKTVLTYTTGGKIAKQDVYDADGKFRYSLKTSYDKYGNPIEQTNALGQTKVASYDELGNCLFTQDFSGRKSCMTEYDFSNRPVSSECKGDDELCLKSSYGYSKTHRLTHEVDPHGATMHYAYDPLGRRIESHLAQLPTEQGQLRTPVIRQAYDSAGNETAFVDAEGHATQKTFNAYGKPVLVTHPDGSQEKYSYFLDGSLESYTDPMDVQTSYIYDFLHRIIVKRTGSAEEQFEYHGQQLASKTDPEGNRTTYQYDAAGRKISEEFAGEITSYSYDSLGRVHKMCTGDLVSVVEHDLLDRITEERQESLSGEVLRKTKYEYDAAGNRFCIVRFAANKETREEQLFDSLDRLVRKTNPLSISEIIHYEDQFINPFGQKVLRKTHTDPMGLQTIETYDSHNEIAVTEKRKERTLALEEKWRNLNGLAISQANTIFSPDGSSRKVFTHWEYDSRNRLRTLTEAAGTLDAKITRYDYTPRGELSKVIKPDGTALDYVYNDLGFLTQLSSSDQTVRHTMAYNRLGHLLQSDSFERTVDPTGRLLQETFRGKYSIENTYDTSGKRIHCKIPAADCLIEYDSNATDLTRVSRKKLDGSLLYAHTYNHWDLAGNLLQETLIDNLGLVHYNIDDLSRKTHITAPQFTQQVVTFDPVGNICHLRTQSDDTLYTYDPLYQLTSETGRFAHTYAYDSLYNRLQKDQERYSINSLHQAVSHLQYTKNGNPSRFGDASYTYDALDRLIAIQTPQFTQAFSYDFDNRCLTRTTASKDGSEVRQFLYDGKNEIGALDEHSRMVELRVLGRAPHAEIGAAVGIELGSRFFAPVHDLQGNVAALLPLDKSAATIFRYSAFGQHVTAGSATAMPWRFSSKRTDDRNGLVNYGRRFYLPQLGRWLTPDPAGFTDGMNLYAFVENDPLTHLDEYGLLLTGNWLIAQTMKDQQEVAFRPTFHQVGMTPEMKLFENSKFQGSAQALSGLTEARIGAGLLPTPFMPLGVFLIAHGCDQYVTGMKQAAFNQQVDSVTTQILQKTGMSHQSATMANGCLGLAGSMVGVSAIRASQAVMASTWHPTKVSTSAINTLTKPKPIWTSTKQRTSVQNAFEHWKNHRNEFSILQNSKQYAETAKSFSQSPPFGTLTKTRPNGDIVLYHPNSNTFIVTSQEGLPRTMYKPNPSIHNYPTNLDYFYDQ